MDAIIFLEKLNSYLNKRFCYREPQAEFIWGRTKIIAETQKFKLFFRLRPPRNIWKQQTFVITRMIFSEKRLGNCRDLLRFINDYCKDLGYKNIGIEYVCDEESKNFAEILGFQRCIDDNYIISCAKLKEVFA